MLALPSLLLSRSGGGGKGREISAPVHLNSLLPQFGYSHSLCILSDQVRGTVQDSITHLNGVFTSVLLQHNH